MNQLESLKTLTTVVADTGDIGAIAQSKPQDATTNPSLLLKAATMPEYAHLVDAAFSHARAQSGNKASAFLDKLAVGFGVEILKLIPGRVSTEVDARASFDSDQTIAQGRRLIAIYEDLGIARERVLIKIAATWEGIQAAAVLEKEGIHTNLTLLFSFAQAVACAEAGVTLISPFVGRIYDYYKKENGADIAPDADPGVHSVTRIYEYFKKYDYRTQVMGASFRKVEQIQRLAGCDLLTISPELLGVLAATPGTVSPCLTIAGAKAARVEKIHLDQKSFLWLHHQDAMATEKLADGIRKFDADLRKLEAYASKRLE